jgi:hypothetical protein
VTTASVSLNEPQQLLEIVSGSANNNKPLENQTPANAAQQVVSSLANSSNNIPSALANSSSSSLPAGKLNSNTVANEVLSHQYQQQPHHFLPHTQQQQSYYPQSSSVQSATPIQTGNFLSIKILSSKDGLVG